MSRLFTALLVGCAALLIAVQLAESAASERSQQRSSRKPIKTTRSPSSNGTVPAQNSRSNRIGTQQLARGTVMAVYQGTPIQGRRKRDLEMEALNPLGNHMVYIGEPRSKRGADEDVNIGVDVGMLKMLSKRAAIKATGTGGVSHHGHHGHHHAHQQTAN